MQYVAMADSVSASALPDGLHAYAGYVDGAWPSFRAVCDRFAGKAHCISITTLGGNARFADCEKGDLPPRSGAAWLAARVPVTSGGFWTPESARTQGIPPVWLPGLYFPEAWLADIVTALHRLVPHIQRSSYAFWGARWQHTVPTEMPAELDALQWYSPMHASYDLSICRGRMFNPPIGNSVAAA